MKDEIKITMLRHGESYDNIDNRYCNKNTGLTELGKKQIEKSKLSLAKFEFSEVYHSPLERTSQTKDILALKSKAEPMIEETDFGIFSGMTFDEIARKYPKESKKWMDDYINYRIPEGESLQDTMGRVKDFIYSLDKSSLLICHEGVIRLVLSLILGDIKFFYDFRISYGSFSQVVVAKNYQYIYIVNNKFE